MSKENNDFIGKWLLEIIKDDVPTAKVELDDDMLYIKTIEHTQCIIWDEKSSQLGMSSSLGYAIINLADPKSKNHIAEFIRWSLMLGPKPEQATHIMRYLNTFS